MHFKSVWFVSSPYSSAFPATVTSVGWNCLNWELVFYDLCTYCPIKQLCALDSEVGLLEFRCVFSDATVIGKLL